MSDEMMVGFIDFPAVLLDSDRVRCVSFWPGAKLVR
jgi:hypothetical protein